MEHLKHEDSILSLKKQIDWNGPYPPGASRPFNEDGTQNPIYPISSGTTSRDPNSSVFFDPLHEEIILFRGQAPSEVFISDKYHNAWFRFPVSLQNPKQSTIQSASLSPQRNYLAIRLSSNEVQIYDTYTGSLIESRACNDTTASIITILWLNPNALVPVSPKDPLHFSTHFNLNNNNSALAYQSSLSGPISQETYLATSLMRRMSPEELTKQCFGSDSGLAAQHNVYSMLPNHLYQQHHANDMSTFQLDVDQLMEYAITHDSGSASTPVDPFTATTTRHANQERDGGDKHHTRVAPTLDHLRSQRPLPSTVTILHNPNDPHFTVPPLDDLNKDDEDEDEDSCEDDEENGGHASSLYHQPSPKPHDRHATTTRPGHTLNTTYTAGSLTSQTATLLDNFDTRDRAAPAHTTFPITCTQGRQERFPQFLVLLTNIGFEVQCLFQDNLQRRSTVPISITDYWFDPSTNTLLVTSPNRLMYLYSLVYHHPQPSSHSTSTAPQSTAQPHLPHKPPTPVGFPSVTATRIAKFEIDERYSDPTMGTAASSTPPSSTSHNTPSTAHAHTISPSLSRYLSNDPSSVQMLSPPIHTILSRSRSIANECSASGTEQSSEKLTQQHQKALHSLHTLHVPTGSDGLLGFNTPISNSTFLEGSNNMLILHRGGAEGDVSPPPSSKTTTTTSPPPPAHHRTPSGYRISLVTVYNRVYVVLHDELSGALLLFTQTPRGFSQTNTFLTECSGRCILTVKDDLLCLTQANNDLIEIDHYLASILSSQDTVVGTTIDAQHAKTTSPQSSPSPSSTKDIFIASRLCVIDIRVSGAAALTNQWIILSSPSTAHALPPRPGGDTSRMEYYHLRLSQSLQNYTSQTTFLLTPSSHPANPTALPPAPSPPSSSSPSSPLPSTDPSTQTHTKGGDPDHDTLFVFYPPCYLLCTTKAATAGTLYTISPRYQQFVQRAKNTQYPLLLGLFVHRRPIICKLLTMSLLRTMLLVEQSSRYITLYNQMFSQFLRLDPDNATYRRCLQITQTLSASPGLIEELVKGSLRSPSGSQVASDPSACKSLYTYHNIHGFSSYFDSILSSTPPSSTDGQPTPTTEGASLPSPKPKLSSFAWLLSRTFVSSIRHSFDPIQDITYWGNNSYVRAVPSPPTDASLLSSPSPSSPPLTPLPQPLQPPLLAIMTKENYSLITQSDIINYIYIPVYFHVMMCPSLNLCTYSSSSSLSSPMDRAALSIKERKVKSEIRTAQLKVLCDTIFEHVRSLFRYQISVQPSLLSFLVLLLLKRKDFHQLSQLLQFDVLDDHMEPIHLLVWFADAYEDYFHLLQHQYHTSSPGTIAPATQHAASASTNSTTTATPLSPVAVSELQKLDPSIPTYNLLLREGIQAEITYILNPKQSNLTPMLFPFMRELERFHMVSKTTTSRRNTTWHRPVDAGSGVGVGGAATMSPPLTEEYYRALWQHSRASSPWLTHTRKYNLAIYPSGVLGGDDDLASSSDVISPQSIAPPTVTSPSPSVSTCHPSPAASSSSASCSFGMRGAVYDILFRTSSGIRILTTLIERLQTTSSLRLVSHNSKLLDAECRHVMLQSAEFTGDDLAMHAIHRFVESGHLKQRQSLSGSGGAASTAGQKKSFL